MRFVVLGGPRGALTCRPVGCPMVQDRYRRWVPLLTVNAPLTAARADYCKRWALEVYR